jgi:hypothetical protein
MLSPVTHWQGDVTCLGAAQLPPLSLWDILTLSLVTPHEIQATEQRPSASTETVGDRP